MSLSLLEDHLYRVGNDCHKHSMGREMHLHGFTASVESRL